MTARLKRQSWAGDAAADSLRTEEHAAHGLLRAAVDVSRSDRCFFFVNSETGAGGPSIEIRRKGRPALPANALPGKIPSAAIQRATATRRPVYYHRASTAPSRRTTRNARRGASLCVPVVVGKTVSAILCLERSSSAAALTGQQRRMIEILAQQAAITIDCADRCHRALRAFQARVNSPFLYNTFSVIAEMVVTDPARAEEAIVMLSRVCRYVLDSPADQIVTLAQELAITRDYLALEQLRLGDRMEVQIIEEGPLESVHVPALILQSLAETTTRLGVARRVGGGCLRVEVSVNRRRCRLRIRDRSLEGVSEEISGDINFGEVERRLRTFYPGAHSFRVDARQGVSVDITIPREALRKSDGASRSSTLILHRAGGM
jgi:LytS/YehU family sensor histidine kinase